MRCVAIDGSGFVVDVDPQPVEVSACALVLSSGGELGANPFNLSQADGEAIAWAVVVVWAIGFAWRAVIQTLKTERKDDV